MRDQPEPICSTRSSTDLPIASEPRAVWVKPTLERLSLRDALANTTGVNQVDLVNTYS